MKTIKFCAAAAALLFYLTACKIMEGAVMTQQGITGNESTYTLDSGKIKLEFGFQGGHLALRQIDANGRDWLSDGRGGGFWRIAFRGPAGEDLEKFGSDISDCRVKTGKNNLVFTWRVPLGNQEALVLATVKVKEASSVSYWSLKVKLPVGWRVTRADYPVIEGIGQARGLKLCVPAGWGLEYDVKNGVSYDAAYPSCLAAMQFLAFYANGKGLYMGAHDPQGGYKRFLVKAEKNAASYTCVNWPAWSKEPGGEYQLPYDAAVGAFTGDYYNAAQIYREFTFKCPWGKGGSLSKRSIPEWLKNTDLWLLPQAEPLKNLELCQKAAEYFDVPISLHWYNWHQIPFDTLYPEYFPAKPQFPDGVKALQIAGLHVMPYINGRLCDPNSQTWKTGGSKWAASKENGEPYTEVYGSKVPLNVMCPYTQGWQDKISGIVGRLVNECGVDGVYIDQIGAAAPELCFNATHGHPVGGGHFWVDAYRSLLDKTRKLLPKGRILTTEENAECWIDKLDALLLVNTPTGENQPIPLFPAVYSGRTITFGFQYIPRNSMEYGLSFRAKMARALLWGSQPGWVSVQHIMDPEAAQDADFLRNLARLRKYAHPYVVDGKFLGMLDAHGDNPRLKTEAPGSFGGTYIIDIPAVLASAWLAEDGKLGVILVNMADEEHKVNVRLPLQTVGLTGKGYAVETYGADGLITRRSDKSGVQSVVVPARNAIMLSLKAKP